MITTCHNQESLLVGEVARIWRSSPAAVYRAIKKGVRLTDGTKLFLFAHRVPGGWRVSQSDLDNFQAQLTADAKRETVPTIQVISSPRRSKQFEAAEARAIQLGL